MNNFMLYSYVLDLHYDFHYRDQIEFDDWDKKKNTIVDICFGIVYAYVFYKCYSEPEHLIVCISN